MGIGYDTILKLRRVEDECAKMGLRIGNPKGGWNRTYGEILAVFPTDDALPIYARDAELFVGNLDELNKWLQGAKWMHDYYMMLKLVNEKKVQKQEDHVRNERLVRKLKNEEFALKGA
jgi:hypothetical protein